MSVVRKNRTGKRPTPELYNAFIDQIDIKNIRLTSAKVENLDPDYFPPSVEVKWKVAASYKNKQDEFDVLHRYNTVISDKEAKAIKARLSVSFTVTYSSKIPMNDEVFKVFEIRNVPVNTWPYLREFTHNMVLRMGWPPLIAPKYAVA